MAVATLGGRPGRSILRFGLDGDRRRSFFCRDEPAGGVPGDVAGGADDRWARSVHRAYPATGARAVVPGGCNGLRAEAGVPGRRAMPDLGPFVPGGVESVCLRSVLLNDRWQAEGV